MKFDNITEASEIQRRLNQVAYCLKIDQDRMFSLFLLFLLPLEIIAANLK